MFSEANEQVTEEEVSFWINIDSNDFVFDFLDDDGIVASVLNKNPSDSESEEDVDNNSCTISNAEAEEVICKYLQWYQNRSDGDLKLQTFF